MIPIAAGVGAWFGARRAGWTRPVVIAAGAALIAVQPIAGVAVAAVAVAVYRWKKASTITERSREADGDVTLLADLVALALGAGLSLRAAIEEAGRHVVAELGGEVDDLVDAMDRVGVSAALADAPGRLEDFGRVAAGAALSGAPLGAAIEAFASARRHAAHSRAVERARRLPVRMLVPLALLILPGFVVLAVGPAVLEALARLGPIP